MNLQTVYVALTFLALFAVATHADEWRARLSCNDSSLVVDGLHNNENGFVDHQLVIRNRTAVSHIQSLIGIPLSLTATGEFIAGSLGAHFNGNVDAEIGRQPFRGPGALVYQLHSHWLDGHRYEVLITSLSCTPGNCGPPPGSVIGSWIFNECNPK